jgi:hypothetical protein
MLIKKSFRERLLRIKNNKVNLKHLYLSAI